MMLTQAGTYFQEVDVYDVPEHQDHRHIDSRPSSPVVNAVLDSGSPELLFDEASSAGLGIPVFRGGKIVSVIEIKTFSSDIATGVIESWEPVGEFDELRLAKGAYGKLERFQNVSSFVRFEYGSGLPGKVWSNQRAMIHQDLANHPGFLRAAGASAGSLDTAIGIPVSDGDYIATVVLISSLTTPLAKGFEVWQVQGHGYELVGAAYSGMNRALQFRVGHVLNRVTGMPGLAAEHGGATTTSNAKFLYGARDEKKGLGSALAIPYYDGDELDSVMVMYF